MLPLLFESGFTRLGVVEVVRRHVLEDIGVVLVLGLLLRSARRAFGSAYVSVRISFAFLPVVGSSSRCRR